MRTEYDKAEVITKGFCVVRQGGAVMVNGFGARSTAVIQVFKEVIL